MKKLEMAGGSSIHIVVSDAPPGFLKRRIVRGHFAKFGPIVKLTIFNSFCVITFETQEQAEKALVQGASWKDLPLKIEYADRHDPFEADGVDINEELNWYAEDEGVEKSRKSGKNKANLKMADAPPKKTSRLEDDDAEEAFKIDDNKVISSAKEGPFQSRIAKTLKDRLEILEDRDRYIRLKLEKIGRIDAAEVTKGTCPDMCPEKERLMRDVNCIVAPYESFPNGKMDHTKAVKEYTRSSADQDEPLPHELRPEPVLTMTMTYIINYIMSRVDETNDENYANWYDFCWGRLRAIRKDIIQQQLCDINIVTILEQCARFHITCYDRLWGTSKSHFDDKINTETLVNCLQSLIHMYEDLHREGVVCPNEAEFNAYMILLKLSSGLLMSDYRRFSPTLKQSHEVKEAVKIHLAYSNNMFSTYFKLIKQTSYLNACLMQRFFHHLRLQALNTIVKAHSVPNKVSNISVNFIMGMLKLDSVSECVSFCDSLGLTLGKDEKYFRISRNDFFIPENIYAIKTPSSLVVNKRIPVAQAVVGADKPLPVYFEHTVHTSFTDDGILNSDAIDASDQEEKMLFDNVSRNVQQTKLKVPVNTNAPQTIPLVSERRDSTQHSISSLPQEVLYNTEGGEDSTGMDDDYDDVVEASTTNKVNDNEAEHNNIEESSNESVASLNSTSSSISSKSSTNTITPEITMPSPPILVDTKPLIKYNPFVNLPKTPAFPNKPAFGSFLNQTNVTGSISTTSIIKSPVTPIQQQKFLFSKENDINNPKVDEDMEKIEKEVTVSKLRKKLTENLKRISARKCLRVWQRKVARIKAMKAAEALIICSVSAENHLKIWGHARKKQFLKTSDRLKERKKASLMVQLILNSDIIDKLDKNVTKIRSKLIDILGQTSVRYANKWGNIAQPVPVFWKLVFAIPPPIQEGSTFPMKFRIWCREAFLYKGCHDISNVTVAVSANGVTVFSKIIILEGLDGIEKCKNLTSLVLVTACDWEKTTELQKRMTCLLNLINHPIPVVVLNLGDCLNEVNPPNYDQVTFFEQILWKNSSSMNEALFNLARNIYLSNLKVKPFCNLLEIYVDKLFDFFRQDRYFHDELDVALLSPNNIITFYNQLINFIEKEISYCYKNNCYGTPSEFRSEIKEFRNFSLWPDGYSDPNFLNCLSLRTMKCKLRPFSSQYSSTAKGLLSFLRLYCDDIGCPEIVSTLMRYIKPPKEDSSIKLADHLDTVDWLRVTELLLGKVLSSSLLSFKVVFREDVLNDFINSRFWLESEVFKYSKR